MEHFDWLGSVVYTTHYAFCILVVVEHYEGGES